VLFGLAKFGGLSGWPVCFLPLLALSAAYRFTATEALAAVVLLAAAVFGVSCLPGLAASYYQYGAWAAVMLLCWSVMSQFTRVSGEQKYRMMYLDQEHTNCELEDRIKDLEKKMQSQTIVDQVTGLKNFRYFRSRIEEEISRAKRKGYVFSLALIEIDDLPEFISAYGETEGRKAALKLAAFLKDVFRNTDLICRYKDNQFLVMMPETDARASLIPMMRFRKKIDAYAFGPENRFGLHISTGISCYPHDVHEVGGLLSLAHGALKRSQQKGQGMITLASSMFKKGAGRLMNSAASRRDDSRTAALIFIAFFVLFLATTAPNIMFEDSGEFTVSSFSLGVGHPPATRSSTSSAALFSRFRSAIPVSE